MKRKKRILYFGCLIVSIFLIILGITLMKDLRDNPIEEPDNWNYSNKNFNYNIIRAVNKGENKNYLISPYSMEIALNMLNDGANNNTKKQISSVINERDIPVFHVDNRINVANAAFVNNKYKEYVLSSYYESLKKDYDADILYDDFKTPKVINDWTNEKTKGMINKLVDNISPNFAMGIANAVAIDVDWSIPFECTSTTSEKFTKESKEKIKVEMMHNSYKDNLVKYFKTNKEQGVILPYISYDKNGEEIDSINNHLEFVGIIPNTDVKTYVSNLTKKKIDSIDKDLKEASDKTTLNVSLPRFKYDYNLTNFKEILIKMGIKDAFNAETADFSNMFDTTEKSFYVDEAIHKTYIDLNEKGTKAAAVTGFMMKESSALIDESEIVNIKFNKPFVYMIRDHKNKEILFFGVVYEPTKWQGSTCKGEF